MQRIISPILFVALTCTHPLSGLAQSERPWELSAPAPQDQLDEDLTPLPRGYGALFVPALTAGPLEPGVVVFHGADRVASGPTGNRIPLPPGDYVVAVGHGPDDGKPRQRVTVRAGVTTPVAPFYGALRVFVVNASGQRIDADYVLSGGAANRVFGPARFDAGDDNVATWLLAPGQYRLGLGTRPDRDEDVVALTIAPGVVTRYQLVVDDGHLLRTQFGEPPPQALTDDVWTVRWVVGGSGSLDRRSHQLTGFNGDMWMVDVFAKLSVGADLGNHASRLNLQLAQAFGGIETDDGADLPFRSLSSNVSAELTHHYRIAASPVAPYARVMVRSAFAETHFVPDDDVAIRTVDEDGVLVRRGEASENDRVRLMKAFAPLAIQEGVGLSLAFIDSDVVTLDLRGGPALRQAYYRQGRFVRDLSNGVLELERIDDTNRLGLEVTAAAGLRIARSVSYETHFDSFIPYKQVLGDNDFKPVFYWDNTFVAKLSRLASVVYSFSLSRGEVVLPNLTLTHGLALRFQHASF